MIKHDEREAIQKIINGQTEFFEDIVNRYKNQISSTIYNILGKCPEAEDIGQEVFLNFYKSIKKFRFESSVGTYLTRIAINLSINELKKRKRNRFLFFDFSDNKHYEDTFQNIEDHTDFKTKVENKLILEKAFDQLKPKYKIIITLSLIQGYKAKEIGEILQIPVGTALTRISRAQKKLKKLILAAPVPK